MRLLLVATALLALAGCSIFSKKDGTEPMDLVDFTPTVSLQKVWQTKIGKGQGAGDTRLTPVIEGELIYVVDHRGRLQALDHRTGKQRWRRNLKEPLAGGIGLGQNKLLLGNDSGEVIALSANDGQELWRRALSGEVLSQPAIGGGVVAVTTMDGRLTVLDADTGAQLWSYDSPQPRLTLRGRSAPVVAGAAIYAAFANGRFLAFDAENGLILWEQRVAMPKGRSDLEKMVDILATPILRDGIFYLNSYQGQLMALSRVSGRPLWAEESSSHQEIWLQDDVIYLSDSDGRVLAYSAGSGSERWRNEQLLRRGLSGPAQLGDYVMAVDGKGYMHVLDAASGDMAARLRVDRSGARAPLLVHDELLYVYANSGKLVAYRIKAR